MENTIINNLRGGLYFFRNNPQILSTIAIALIIVVGFIFSAERFVRVAVDAQSRLARDRITSVLDVFTVFAGNEVNLSSLQGQVVRIKEENKSFRMFKVVRALGNKYEVIASAKEEEIGQLDLGNDVVYGFALGQPAESFYFSFLLDDGSRGYKAARAIVNSEGVTGVVYLEASLAEADKLVNQGIKTSYLILAGILIVIMILFFRHARIIDYAKLYKDLEGVSKMKDDFLSMASHELRTPLTIIRGYADLIMGASGLSEQDKKNAENISMAASQLNTLVADMLDVSRIEQGKLLFNLESVVPSVFVKEVAETFGETAKNKGLALVIEVPDLPNITVDKDRLRQALVNIIGNAVKYTPRGEVRVTGGLDDKHRVIIRVSDTGLGISAEEQKKLFQKFYRVKGEETKEITGTGLGLWITKIIVEQMGGEISLESIKDTGSHFILTFPPVNISPKI